MTDQGRKVLNIVLSLIVSMAAWVFVVYNYDPMINVRYSDIPVQYTGLETLANRGYAVSETNHETVDVVLQQKRVDTANISADDISVTADVSSLDSGDSTVALSVSGPDGASVSDVSAKAVTVEIERAGSEDMDVSVEYTAEADEYEEPIVTELSNEIATVVATEDRLKTIDRVAVVLDPDELGDKLQLLTYDLVALDKDGNKVLNVTIYPEAVSFKAAAGYTKEVRLNVPVKDESDDSYERTYTAPQTVVIKASKDTLDNITSITADEVDVTYLYEDTEVPLEFELPDGVYFANEQNELTLKVEVAEKQEEETDNS